MNAFSMSSRSFAGAARTGNTLVAAKSGAHRAALSTFFARRGHGFVVAETTQEVLLHLKSGDFDLLISALRDADSVELVRVARRVAPGLPVIVISTGSDEDLDAGHLDFAAGLKREVFGGGASARLSKLTAREREVLDLVVSGRTNKVIAYELSISPRTVENHRGRIMDKLRVKSVAELVRIALNAQTFIAPVTGEIAAAKSSLQGAARVRA